MLHRNKQLWGDVLQAWMIKAADRGARQPKGTTAAKWPKNSLRDFTIREVIQALGRCGMPATTNEREHGPACEVCAEVFGLQPGSIRKIWNKRNVHPHVIRLLPQTA